MKTSKAIITLTIDYDTADLLGNPDDIIKEHWKYMVQTLRDNGDLSGYNDMTVNDYQLLVSVETTE